MKPSITHQKKSASEMAQRDSCAKNEILMFSSYQAMDKPLAPGANDGSRTHDLPITNWLLRQNNTTAGSRHGYCRRCYRLTRQRTNGNAAKKFQVCRSKTPFGAWPNGAAEKKIFTE